MDAARSLYRIRNTVTARIGHEAWKINVRAVTTK